jgi:hypothetical protein
MSESAPPGIGRRVFLHRAAVALGGALAASLPFGRARAQEQPAWTAIGFSQGGLPLVIHHLGQGATRLFLLGGQHGGPEANTTALAQALLEHVRDHPDELPVGLALDVMPLGNPDGTAARTRQFLDGVDPNRNWGGSDWSPDAYDSNGHFRPGLGGPAPFSAQETRALRDWLLANRPALVVNYHSAGGFLFGPREGLGGDLADAYAAASGYARPAPGGPSPLPYRATGSMNVWLREVGIDGLLVELASVFDPEIDPNLDAVRALLALLGSHTAARAAAASARIPTLAS